MSERSPRLFIGESWFIHSIHQKGFDSFQTSEYVEGAERFLTLMAELGHQMDYVPAHRIENGMPTSAAELAKYGTVVISDVGANTFLLGSDTFSRSLVGPNRLNVLAEYVRAGGGLVMVGGYMSFAGIEGKARYGSSPLQSVLPVAIQTGDDRSEHPEGSRPVVVTDHPILKGVSPEWPCVLGYNQVHSKPGSQVVVECNGDPLLVVGTYGGGRCVAFMSDLAPHWAPPSFVEWSCYGRLWSNILDWASGTLVEHEER